MLSRIATWSIAALLACSLVATAEAKPQKPRVRAEPEKPKGLHPQGKPVDRPQGREHPIRALPVPTVMTQPAFENGKLERLDDGALVYSVALSPEQREQMAQRTGKPLSQIPERILKHARIDYRSLTPERIRARLGQEVSLELRQDPYGFVYATSLGAPRQTKK